MSQSCNTGRVLDRRLNLGVQLEACPCSIYACVNVQPYASPGSQSVCSRS